MKTTKNVNLEVIFKNSKSGKPISMLCVDLGYRKLALSFDDVVIAEIMGVSVGELIKNKLDSCGNPDA